MKNNFYTEFDLTRIKESKRESDYRTPFQIDRDRIIHSSEFRRLQGKTQVFLPGEYDFYRTRLTHSIEVAQIGRSICNYLIAKETNEMNDEYHIDSDLVECICLSHDLGHPPFGHAGERTLNGLMKEFGGFEGNAQTFRLLTEIFYRIDDHRRGMNPTRAFLDGVLKYKSLYGQLNNPENHFLYDDQEEFLKFVFDGKNIFKELPSGIEPNSFQSIECQIMDWADDTAYAINDIVDSISAGFITIAKLIRWQNENSFSEEENKLIDELVDLIKNGKFKAGFGLKIGTFIQACSLEKRNTFMDGLTNRYKYKLVVEPDILNKAKFYKKLSRELVFRSSQLHQMEFKGDKMIERLFMIFKENYIDKTTNIKLLPDFSDKLIKQTDGKNMRARLICDYIAGMTDNFAMRNYRRLFDPDYSSLVDLI